MSNLTDAEIDTAWRSVGTAKPYDEYRMLIGRAIEAATAAKYAERIAELQAKLDAAAKLLKRAPKATRSMYVGTDIEPWGVQAAALVRSIDAMRTGDPKP